MLQLGWRAFRIRMRDKNSSSTNTLVLCGTYNFNMHMCVYVASLGNVCPPGIELYGTLYVTDNFPNLHS